MRLDDARLEKLLRDGESFCVEFKESLSRSALEDVREAVCAFANDLPDSDAPGVVFIGVRDDRTPIGIKITDEMLRQLSDIKDIITPQPSLLVEKRTLRGVDVAVITVLPSDSTPVRYKSKIHVRFGPRRSVATPQDERLLNEKRRMRDIPFDLQPVTGAGIGDLSLLQFHQGYLPSAVSAETLAANERSLKEQLAATKMIASADDPRATILGLLVLGNLPRDFIESAYIQFLRIDGDDWSDPIVDEQVIDGTISDIMLGTDQKLQSHIRTHVDITGSTLERRTYTYPFEALQQITRNAVMHRAYEQINAPVRITWLNDRIEIISPGRALIGLEDFWRIGRAFHRNPNLAEAMKNLGYVQRFGVGISIARRRLRENGNPDLEFDLAGDFVQATIRKAQA